MDTYAFKITRRSDGHEYKIFADGRIEGFEDTEGLVIYNKIPQINNQAFRAGREFEAKRDRLPDTRVEATG
jgi:hypothetical protein